MADNAHIKMLFNRILSRLDTLHDLADSSAARLAFDSRHGKHEKAEFNKCNNDDFSAYFKPKILDLLNVSEELDAAGIMAEMTQVVSDMFPTDVTLQQAYLFDIKHLLDRTRETLTVWNVIRCNGRNDITRFEPSAVSFFELIYNQAMKMDKIGRFVSNSYLPKFTFAGDKTLLVPYYQILREDRVEDTYKTKESSKSPELLLSEFIQLCRDQREKIASFVLGTPTKGLLVDTVQQKLAYLQAIRSIVIGFYGLADETMVNLVVDTSKISFAKLFTAETAPHVRMRIVCNVAELWDASESSCKVQDLNAAASSIVHNKSDVDTSIFALNKLHLAEGTVIFNERMSQNINDVPRSVPDIAACIRGQKGLDKCRLIDKKEVLLDLKRSGDALQALMVQHLSSRQPGSFYLFVTLDHLAFLKARIAGVPAMFTSLTTIGEDNAKVMTLFNPGLDVPTLKKHLAAELGKLKATYDNLSELRIAGIDINTILSAFFTRAFEEIKESIKRIMTPVLPIAEFTEQLQLKLVLEAFTNEIMSLFDEHDAILHYHLDEVRDYETKITQFSLDGKTGEKAIEYVFSLTMSDDVPTIFRALEVVTAANRMNCLLTTAEKKAGIAKLIHMYTTTAWMGEEELFALCGTLLDTDFTEYTTFANSLVRTMLSDNEQFNTMFRNMTDQFEEKVGRKSSRQFKSEVDKRVHMYRSGWHCKLDSFCKQKTAEFNPRKPVGGVIKKSVQNYSKLKRNARNIVLKGGTAFTSSTYSNKTTPPRAMTVYVPRMTALQNRVKAQSKLAFPSAPYQASVSLSRSFDVNSSSIVPWTLTPDIMIDEEREMFQLKQDITAMFAIVDHVKKTRTKCEEDSCSSMDIIDFDYSLVSRYRYFLMDIYNELPQYVPLLSDPPPAPDSGFQIQVPNYGINQAFLSVFNSIQDNDGSSDKFKEFALQTPVLTDPNFSFSERLLIIQEALTLNIPVPTEVQEFMYDVVHAMSDSWYEMINDFYKYDGMEPVSYTLFEMLIWMMNFDPFMLLDNPYRTEQWFDVEMGLLAVLYRKCNMYDGGAIEDKYNLLVFDEFVDVLCQFDREFGHQLNMAIITNKNDDSNGTNTYKLDGGYVRRTLADYHEKYFKAYYDLYYRKQ